MKYSEAPDSLREEQVKYLTTRWEELAQLERKWIDAVFQYLFITSSGAAVGTLTFMGATVQAKDPVQPWMVLMLVLFVLSVLAVGLGKASQFFYISGIYTDWRKNSAIYFNDGMDWEELNRLDTEKSKDSSLVKFLSWLSFIFFVAGLVVGFSQLSGGLLNGKPIEPETTKPPATADAATAPIPPASTNGPWVWTGPRDRIIPRNPSSPAAKAIMPPQENSK
jgi:hypothetical protein